jgi:hypothetical protein
MPPSRTVKYIVSGALTEVKMQTSYLSASPSDFDKAFNGYIDMLAEFENDGIITGIAYPDQINANIGYEVPHNDLIMMLAERISNQFSYTLTTRQGSLAQEGYSRLIARQPRKKMACNPVPNGYRFYNYPTDCCCGIHDDCTCSSCSIDSLQTETGINILTG